MRLDILIGIYKTADGPEFDSRPGGYYGCESVIYLFLYGKH